MTIRLGAHVFWSSAGSSGVRTGGTSRSVEKVLGLALVAILMAMLRQRDELATKNDLLRVRDELRGELAALRGELKGEMSQLRSDMNGFIRTFTTVQAGTVVGATGIVYALVRLT